MTEKTCIIPTFLKCRAASVLFSRRKMALNSCVFDCMMPEDLTFVTILAKAIWAFEKVLHGCKDFKNGRAYYLLFLFAVKAYEVLKKFVIQLKGKSKF